VGGCRLARGEDKGAEWVEKTLGWSVDLVERPRKPAPEEVLMRWAREWAKEGVSVDWQRLLPPQRLRGVAEEVGGGADDRFDRSEQEDELRDYERLPESGEAFIYVAMSRLMLRRLAR
jgi:hypothetical protein